LKEQMPQPIPGTDDAIFQTMKPWWGKKLKELKKQINIQHFWLFQKRCAP
jgi:hypothetical protein